MGPNNINRKLLLPANIVSVYREAPTSYVFNLSKLKQEIPTLPLWQQKIKLMAMQLHMGGPQI